MWTRTGNAGISSVFLVLCINPVGCGNRNMVAMQTMRLNGVTARNHGSPSENVSTVTPLLRDLNGPCSVHLWIAYMKTLSLMNYWDDERSAPTSQLLFCVDVSSRHWWSSVAGEQDGGEWGKYREKQEKWRRKIRQASKEKEENKMYK
jgi:hypothetical protein